MPDRYLNNNSLSGTIPSSFSNLTSLQRLCADPVAPVLICQQPPPLHPMRTTIMKDTQRPDDPCRGECICN